MHFCWGGGGGGYLQGAGITQKQLHHQTAHPQMGVIQENCKPGTNSLGSLQAAPQYKHLSLLFGCQCLCPQQWFIPVDPLGRALRKLQTFCSKAHVSFYDLLFTS